MGPNEAISGVGSFRSVDEAEFLAVGGRSVGDRSFGDHGVGDRIVGDRSEAPRPSDAEMEEMESILQDYEAKF